MTPTIDELKNRYYKLVVKKADVIYSSWGKKRKTSKLIVIKANKYIFDKRLKADGAFRFQALAFAYALGMRLQKRYATFLRKLFHLFAFIRERDAFKRLKRALGFDSFTDMREAIKAEIENVFAMISRRRKREETGGGKRTEIGKLSIEEEMEKFLEDCALEESQKGNEKDIGPDKEEQVESKEALSPVKIEGVEREKINLVEIEQAEKELEFKKEGAQKTKTEQTKQEQIFQEKTAPIESENEVKTTEKSVASTSILAELMVAEQEKEEELPSPFPIFRDENNEKTVVGKNETFNVHQEHVETNSTMEKTEKVEEKTWFEEMQSKSPFPIFRGEKFGDINPIDKPIDKPFEGPAEKERLQGSIDEYLSDEITPVKRPLYKKMEVSEENRARIELNVTMSKQQIDALVSQIKENANLVMAQEEQAWREKISIAEGGNEEKPTVKTVVSSQNNEEVINALKK